MIQLPQFGSVPFSTLAARTASISCGRQGFMIAEVMPAPIPIGMKPALMPWRCGRPTEILERPQVDRKGVVEGKSGSVRVDLGGSRCIKKTTKSEPVHM